MEKVVSGMKCVILANGQFPESEHTLDALQRAEYICCCDGAVEKLLAVGREPDVIVGDGDSVSPEIRDKYSHLFIKREEQEYNDLTKATRYCIEQGFNEILYLGATGLREDHTLGNIFLLPFYLDNFGINPVMLTDEGVFTIYHGSATIDTLPEQNVSIFNISCKVLNGVGLKWRIYPFAQHWQGTLNQSVGTSIFIEADGTYIVFRRIV